MTLHMDITKWSVQVKLIVFFFLAQDRGAVFSQQKTRLRDDWGSDHKLFIAKSRLKLKEVGKITRPFRFDLNKIPYDYSVEMTHRFKELDLIECPKNYGQGF